MAKRPKKGSKKGKSKQWKNRSTTRRSPATLPVTTQRPTPSMTHPMLAPGGMPQNDRFGPLEESQGTTATEASTAPPENRISENDSTKYCGRIRESDHHIVWLSELSVIIDCGPVRGRLQICDIICPDGSAPFDGDRTIKCFVFKDGRASLSRVKEAPKC